MPAAAAAAIALPHVIVTGEVGPLATAPPFSDGFTGTFAPTASNI